ncbi:MAG: hypothetical protein EB127_27475 [Alphaproteobacteria bacterium]|nr:hypothetical protein [Alphaproteobacteria bacterium]
MTLFSKILSYLQDFIFPIFCLSCQSKIAQGMLCSSCSLDLAIADITQRCPICFTEHNGLCEECSKQGSKYRQAFVSEGMGPALALVKNIRSYPEIVKNIGALMTVQLCKLSWSVPDVIIPIIQNRYDPQSLAKAITTFIPIEISPSLGLKHFYFYRYGIGIMQRYPLSNRFIYSDKSCLILSTYPLSAYQKESIASELALCYSGELYFLSFLS